MNNSIKTPWLGLASYEETDSEIFYGRTKEIEDLFGDIHHNTQTVIYGPSGTGKTSIIRAGIFPLARRSGYLPIFIRLNHDTKSAYTTQIIDSIKRALNDIHGEIEQKQPALSHSTISLWEFFHGNIFWTKDNYTVVPLIVLDQFEEIFTQTNNRQSIRNFFNELSDFCDNTMPQYMRDILNKREDRPQYSERINYRLVLCLREDFLARLEEFSEKIPALRRNRYSLQAINEEQAMEIILKPSNGMVSEDVAIEIIKKVTNSANFKIDGIPEITVETALLSLFCNELNKKRIDDGLDEITFELLERFGDNIIAEFYENTMGLISESSMLYLENSLLTKKGYRDSIALGDAFDSGVTPSEIDILQQNRLIHVDEWDGTKRIEFTHDVLCKVAKEKRDKRDVENELKKEKEKVKALEKDRRSFFRVIMCIDLSIIALLSVFSIKTFLNYPYDSSNTYNQIPIIPSIFITCFILLFRTNISLLILKNEKKGIHASILLLLFLILQLTYLKETLDLGSEQLKLFLKGYIFDSVWVDNSVFLFLVVFYFFPLLYYFGKLYFNWRTTNNSITWLGLITCSNIIKTYKNIYFLLLVILLISMTIGMKSNNVYYALFGFPLILVSSYSILIYKSATKISYKLLLIASSIVFILFLTLIYLQYKVLFFSKIYIYVLIWVAFIFISSNLVKQIGMVKLSYRIIKTLILFSFSFFLIPLLLIGYLYFIQTDYAIVGSFNTKYSSQGIYLIKDKKNDFGLRDRKELIIPVEFDSVMIFDDYYKVCKKSKWGLFDEYKTKQNKTILDILLTPNENITKRFEDSLIIPCLFSEIDFLDREHHKILIVTNNDGNKGIINLSKSREYDFRCKYRTIKKIQDSNNEFLLTDKSMKKGIFDIINNKEIISCKYDSIVKIKPRSAISLISDSCVFYKVFVNGEEGLFGAYSNDEMSLIRPFSKFHYFINCASMTSLSSSSFIVNLNQASIMIIETRKQRNALKNVILNLKKLADETNDDIEKNIYNKQAVELSRDFYETLKKGSIINLDSMLNSYGSFSWYLLFQKSYIESEKYARLILKEKPREQWVKANLAHALLFQNHYEEAKKIYLELKDIRYQRYKRKTFKDVFLSDFDELEKAGITHPNIAKIRELLK